MGISQHRGVVVPPRYCGNRQVVSDELIAEPRPRTVLAPNRTITGRFTPGNGRAFNTLESKTIHTKDKVR